MAHGAMNNMPEENNIELLKMMIDRVLDKADSVLNDMFNLAHNPHLPSEVKRKQDADIQFAILEKEALEIEFSLNQFFIRRNEEISDVMKQQEKINKEIAEERRSQQLQDYLQAQQQKLQQQIEMIRELKAAIEDKVKAYDFLANVVQDCFNKLKDPENPKIEIPGLPKGVEFKYNDVADYIANNLPNKLKSGEIKAKNLDAGIHKMASEYFNRHPAASKLEPELRTELISKGYSWIKDRINSNPEVSQALRSAQSSAVVADNRLQKQIEKNSKLIDRMEINIEAQLPNDRQPILENEKSSAWIKAVRTQVTPQLLDEFRSRNEQPVRNDGQEKDKLSAASSALDQLDGLDDPAPSENSRRFNL